MLSLIGWQWEAHSLVGLVFINPWLTQFGTDLEILGMDLASIHGPGQYLIELVSNVAQKFSYSLSRINNFLEATARSEHPPKF